ncbi:MAG: DUF58 domain-containing protein [Lachnospiraceae bacterium]|nr:DUF58 domain-containing protein [Lachnospiraceae bacterium]
MVGIICVAIVVILILEYTLAKKLVPYVVYKSVLDKSLFEPGEEIEMTSEILNYNKVLVPFVRVREYLPPNIEILSDTRDVYTGTLWQTIEKTVTIKAKERLSRREVFKLHKRGIYSFGEYEVSVGDIFGLRETTVFGSIPHSVYIMPERAENQDLKEIVEGFIGDISVRRFIMEDPILTIGFNDYTGREPMRDISWIRTAVANKLQVKKYDYTTDINVTVMLNCDGVGDEELEECYRITRMVVEKLESAKIPYAFRTNGMLFGPTGHMQYVPKGLGDNHLREILFGLATAQLGRAYSFPSLVEKVIKERKQNENYFLITRVLDKEGQAAFGRLQRSCDGEIGLITARGTAV